MKTGNRATKIVATLGPGVDQTGGIRALIEAGLNVARLNFSHGTHDEHLVRLRRVREAADELGVQVAVLQDLCGPKVRIGKVSPVSAEVKSGDRVYLVEGEEASYPEIAIPLSGYAETLQPDDTVLLDDGRIALRVVESTRGRATCEAIDGGHLRDRIGVHLPARSVHLPTFTEKDQRDLEFGLEHGVDYVAVSFVRHPNDLVTVREFCAKRGKRVPLVAKIETPQAIEHLNAIVAEADGVMVARGDLGVEFPPEKVPVLQRQIIAEARAQHTPVIVATEMLQSMVHEDRPTRAEASDVANAVFGGADAVMLSAETATGDHPSLAIEMMARIVNEAEKELGTLPARPGTAERGSVAESIAFNAADVAEEVDSSVLVAFTESGATARLVSSARPRVPIVGFSPIAETCRRMALLWGVTPVHLSEVQHSDHMLELAAAKLASMQFVRSGDLMTAVFGSPVGKSQRTNTVSVRVIE